MITLVASIILHHLFEKQYLQMNWKGVVPLVLVLILGNAYLQYSIRNDKFWQMSVPDEIQDIVAQNKVFFNYIWKTEPQIDECIEKELVPPSNEIYGQCRFPVSFNSSLEHSFITMNFSRVKGICQY